MKEVEVIREEIDYMKISLHSLKQIGNYGEMKPLVS
jgi:hypothetical protein